ncbi:translation machinery-associated protein 16 [Mariannaea sp. PMI_226]|nr:translation machinery-associated protein 16 [Mariannaea sp. PMI_226]
MPGSLDKTRKQISKKRNGVINALHEKSRDSLRLHKAGVRDQRIEKLAAARSKKERPLIDRVSYFQNAIRVKGGEGANPAAEIEEVKRMIHSFVHQFDEEYDAEKKKRRAGRPASVKEDMLKMKISTLETEYKQGFLLPDIMSSENANALLLWEGSWSYLPQLKWTRVNSEGQVRSVAFPST